jgi:uncharacterized membrane protein
MIPILRWGLREPIEIPQKIPSVLVTETFSVGAYLLVLVSMSLVGEVNYVVALRQLSIPMAIGVLWLGEKLSMSRMQAIMLMLIGLVLVTI